MVLVGLGVEGAQESGLALGDLGLALVELGLALDHRRPARLDFVLATIEIRLALIQAVVARVLLRLDTLLLQAADEHSRVDVAQLRLLLVQVRRAPVKLSFEGVVLDLLALELLVLEVRGFVAAVELRLLAVQGHGAAVESGLALIVLLGAGVELFLPLIELLGAGVELNLDSVVCLDACVEIRPVLVVIVHVHNHLLLLYKKKPVSLHDLSSGTVELITVPPKLSPLRLGVMMRGRDLPKSDPRHVDRVRTAFNHARLRRLAGDGGRRDASDRGHAEVFWTEI